MRYKRKVSKNNDYLYDLFINMPLPVKKHFFHIHFNHTK